jgi:hypothetical protein
LRLLSFARPSTTRQPLIYRLLPIRRRPCLHYKSQVLLILQGVDGIAPPTPWESRRMKLEPFLKISLLLLIAWAGSFLVFHVASVMIHMLLVLAVMFFVGHLVRDANTT